jgi:hypothetical protein
MKVASEGYWVINSKLILERPPTEAALVRPMREFLVSYDYGQGALWWWIAAEAPADITAAFRDVEVLESPPAWWSASINAHVRHLSLATAIEHDKALAGLARSSKGTT